MDEEALEIKVYLTTTKHMIDLNAGIEGKEIDKRIIENEYPVCSSCVFIPLFGQAEKELEDMADFMIEGMNGVFIDPDERTVFVGNNINDVSSSALTYKSRKDDPYAEDFFRRWKETHCTLFEYSVISVPPEKMHQVSKFIVFININGLWLVDKWRWLKRTKQPMFIKSID